MKHWVSFVSVNKLVFNTLLAFIWKTPKWNVILANKERAIHRNANTSKAPILKKVPSTRTQCLPCVQGAWYMSCQVFLQDMLHEGREQNNVLFPRILQPKYSLCKIGHWLKKDHHCRGWWWSQIWALSGYAIKWSRRSVDDHDPHDGSPHSSWKELLFGRQD